jgi:hypothetical protein
MVVVIAEAKRTSQASAFGHDTVAAKHRTSTNSRFILRGRTWLSATSLFAPAILQMWQCTLKAQKRLHQPSNWEEPPSAGEK